VFERETEREIERQAARKKARLTGKGTDIENKRTRDRVKARESEGARQ